MRSVSSHLFFLLEIYSSSTRGLLSHSNLGSLSWYQLSDLRKATGFAFVERSNLRLLSYTMEYCQVALHSDDDSQEFLI